MYVGYRYYDTLDRDVLFSFGHGLSYTTFSTDALKIEADDKTLLVSVGVTNTGNISGSEVLQVYVAHETPSIRRPKKELKGFKKVYLEPGARESVDISADIRYATSFWDEYKGAWKSESGKYKVLVGSGSQGAFLEGHFQIDKTVYWKGL